MSAQLSQLKNGMHIVTENMPELETTSLGVWVNVGARSETEALNGISHMLEHMAFKGTTTRSARDIVEQIESVGGQLNAYTSREQTAYFARVLGDDVPLAIDILSDILLNSTFLAEEVERERGVILQEIGEAFDTPDDLVFDLLQAAAFPDQAVGRPILGTPTQVNSFTGEKLADYMHTHYRPDRMVVVAAGKIDHDELVAEVQNRFAGLENTSTGDKEAAAYVGGNRRVGRELEQIHLALGFPGFSFDDPDIYAAGVMSSILGGGMSSRLFQEVREKRGLAYSIYSFSATLIDGGLFGIYAGTSPAQASELAQVIAREVRRMKKGIDHDEFERARIQLKASTLMALESSGNRVELFARQLFVFGRLVPMAELVEKLDAVTPDDVIRTVDRILVPGGLSLAAVGPDGHLDGFDTISDQFYG